VIIGAGPGGLQAGIYLGRYNRDVVLLDRSGGRTWHARHVENFLGHRAVSGREVIETGLEQVRSFGVKVLRASVRAVRKSGELFEVEADGALHKGRFVIASSGVRDNLPSLENVHRFLGTSFFTCVDCDGYRMTGKRSVVIGDSIDAVRLALAIREMYTRDLTLVLASYEPPPDYAEELEARGVALVMGRPRALLGGGALEAVELAGGRRLPCETVMSSFGYSLNDDFLTGLGLEKDSRGKYIVNHYFESSVGGLYIVGPLNTGNDQIVIAAGQGATAAIDIKKRLLAI